MSEYFGDVEPFLRENDEVSPANRRRVLEILDDPQSCKRELLCHGQGLARSLLPSAVVRRNFNNDKLSTCIYCTLQLLVVQVVVQKSALDRKTLLLIGIPGPGNAS